MSKSLKRDVVKYVATSASPNPISASPNTASQWGWETAIASMAGPEGGPSRGRPAQSSLGQVFMRHCPCCGSEVFYDREKDVTAGIEPEAGYLKIRFKDGQIREVKVAEGVLIP